MQHFKSLAAYMDYAGLPRPEHPMLSVILAKGDDFMPCVKESSPPVSNDCYNISLKKIIKGKLNYGRTKYDFSNGAMIFLAPRQVLQWDSSLVVEQKGFSITFHEDFLKGTPLARQIKRYNFFSYAAHEALHLSPKEEKMMESICMNIEMEYQNNQDEFSKEIIISQLDTLLKYANRFYKRQFLNRQDMSSNLSEQFNQQLMNYFDADQFHKQGLPSIEVIADQLNVSQRYLSDALKRETGKTAQEHLHLFLIDEAKDMLLEPEKSISEVAYELGFEYPQYFSRLFKKKLGVSPSVYRNEHLLN